MRTDINYEDWARRRRFCCPTCGKFVKKFTLKSIVGQSVTLDAMCPKGHLCCIEMVVSQDE